MSQTRSATLRVAHEANCKLRQIQAKDKDGKPKVSAEGKPVMADPTTLDSAKKDAGCTCRPSYYTLYRDSTSRPVKGARVKNRQVADRALAKLNGELAEDRVGLKRLKRIEFGTWVDKWTEQLHHSNQKPSTIHAYLVSTEYARRIFGGFELREIGNVELREFVQYLREGDPEWVREDGTPRPLAPNSDQTIVKHLRHLSACFEAAYGDKYLESNPVGQFRVGNKFEVHPSQANYFTDGELQRLWAQLRNGIPKDGRTVPVAPVYLHLCRFAVATGARVGELVALRWGDVILSDGPHGEVRIDKTWSDRYGETKPKTRKSTRTLTLTEAPRRVLEEWVAIVGVQDDDALVFPNSSGKHLSPANLNDRVLNPALAAAGIPKVGHGSPEPRSFHTFRHCFARLMLEQGQDLQWVAEELGHESTATTEKVYGHWSKEAKRAKAAAIPASSMPV